MTGPARDGATIALGPELSWELEVRYGLNGVGSGHASERMRAFHCFIPHSRRLSLIIGWYSPEQKSGMLGLKLFYPFTTPIACAAIFAAVIPVLVAIGVVHWEASQREKAQVIALSLQALRRSEETADQILAGSRLYDSLPESEACSVKGLALLRRIDLNSTLLQAAGHLGAGNVIDCSSVGGRQAIALGPPDFGTETGAINWTGVKLFDEARPYLVVSKGSFVGIVHKELPLAFVDNTPGMTVSTFNWSHRKPLIERGAIDPSWISPGLAENTFFRRNGHAVAVVRSKIYDIGSVAAVPLANTARFTSQVAMVLLPLGVIIGLLFATFLVGSMRARLSMPHMIRGALRSKEFHLLYQPVVDLATRRTIGAEALIRWTRPDGATIPPDHFIGIAEQAGVIGLITKRVLELLTTDIRRVLRVKADFHFAVNFSVADIHSSELLDDIQRFATHSGLPLNQLVVEATERSFVDVARANLTIQKLRAVGVKVAIDDFGTGYSSLSYLAHLDVDILKIDKLFVDALGTDAATSLVAERIIEMAKDLKLQMVAEGIETDAQAQWLKKLSVEYAQGYLFARPMPIEDLIRRMRAENAPALVRVEGALAA